MYVTELNLAQLLRLRVAFHALPLFHLRTEKLPDSGNQPLHGNLIT